jgi:hypothetical protein
MCVVVGDLDSGCVQDSVYFFVVRERPLIVLEKEEFYRVMERGNVSCLDDEGRLPSYPPNLAHFHFANTSEKPKVQKESK